MVVVDNEDRENEGDLIIAAEDMTVEKMSFMIRYSGYTSFLLTFLLIIYLAELFVFLQPLLV